MSDLNFDDLTDAQKRLFAVRCARRVQHFMTDPRSIAALDVAERHAKGEATDEELAAAWDAAWDAACDEARAAAWDAAWDAACDEARDAARVAAMVAAWWDAARVAARVAAWAAAMGTAWAAERAAQAEILEQIRKEVQP